MSCKKELWDFLSDYPVPAVYGSPNGTVLGEYSREKVRSAQCQMVRSYGGFRNFVPRNRNES